MYDDIVDDIYDPKIENPEYQKLMTAVIKGWIREGISRGVVLGKEEFALEIGKVIKGYMNPEACIVVVQKNR